MLAAISVPPVVLVVDDDAHVLRAVERTLRHACSRVFVAFSVEEALHLVDSEAPSLVISDYELGPGLDGLSFLMKVKEILPGAICVLHTGTTAVPVLEAGVTLLPKGSPTEDLLRLVAGLRREAGN
jgi:DNA-binding NtrC family response regulator